MPLQTNHQRSATVKPLTDALMHLIVNQRPYQAPTPSAVTTPGEQATPEQRVARIWQQLEPAIQEDPQGNQALYHLTENPDDVAARHHLRERLYRLFYRNPALVTQFQRMLHPANDPAGFGTSTQDSNEQ